MSLIYANYYQKMTIDRESGSSKAFAPRWPWADQSLSTITEGMLTIHVGSGPSSKVTSYGDMADTDWSAHCHRGEKASEDPDSWIMQSNKTNF